MYGGVHLFEQFNRAAALVKEKAVSITYILISLVDLLLNLCLQTVIKCDNRVFSFPLLTEYVALVGESQFTECTVD